MFRFLIPRRVRGRRGTLGIVLALTWLSGVSLDLAAAQSAPQTPPADTPASAPRSRPVPLVIQNRQIVLFRAPFHGYSPQERAEGSALRIMRAVEMGRGGKVSVRATTDGNLVTISDQAVFAITPGDLNAVAGETLEQVTAQVVETLTLALDEMAEQRSLSSLLRAVGFTVLATVIFLLLLRGAVRGRRWLQRRLPEVTGVHAREVHLGGFTLLQARQLVAFTRRLIDIIVGLVVLGLADAWLTFGLKQFPFTRPWGEALDGYLLLALKQIANGMIGALPGIFFAALIFFIARYLVRLAKGFFAAVEAGKVALPGLHPETAQPTRRIVVAVLWAFAFVFAYPYLPGSDSEAFKALGVFAGVMLSLGSTGIVTQAMSGLVLMYSRALKPGDYVRINQTEGTVLSLGMLSTKIRTVKDEEVTIPNGVIVGTETKNFSRLAREGGVILYTSVTIGYNAPWRQVHAMLIRAADRTPGLRKDPKPFVLQSALSDFYVEYQVNAYLERPEERIPTLAALHANIQDAFNEYGVQILSPHYLADPPEKVWVPKAHWYAEPAKPPQESPGASTS